MKSQVEFKTASLLRGFGTFEWFGGVNCKAGLENHFGFLANLSGEDIFLRRRELQGEDLLTKASW